MKTLVFALTLLASNLAFSDIHRVGTADFSSLYNGFNAGIYQVEVKVTPKNELVTGITSRRMVHDDGMNFCTTTVKFDVGTAELKVTNGDWSTIQKYPVTATLSQRSDDETCDTSILKTEGQTKFYIELSSRPTALPIQAPKGYSTVYAQITPFRGYLTSSAFIDLDDWKQVIDPKELLNDSAVISTSSNAFDLYYYVFSSNERSSLSLANGIIKLK